MAGYNGHNGHNGYAQAPVREDERPLGELFRELADETRYLVSAEVALAKSELTEKAAATGKDMGYMAAGGFVIYAGSLAIIAAIIVGLANLIPAWLSALIVGVLLVLGGYLLLRTGMNDMKRRNLAPQRTIQTLQDNKDWVQDQVRSASTQGGS